MSRILMPAEYSAWLADVKLRIRAARSRAALAVNEQLIALYHEIGTDILQRQGLEGWGAKVIAQLAADLKTAFPDMGGLSRTNLSYMRQFAEQCPTRQFLQQPVGQLPWGHIVTLLSKLNDNATRAWYAAQVLTEGWTRAALEAAIRRHAHRALGAAPTNFPARLPPDLAGAAQAVLKDPYAFAFLGLGDDAREKAIEDAMIERIQHLLMELGRGFAFVGRQVELEVGGDTFRVDLLFYHLRLHCYVVVELKADAFKPEHTGQLSFYVTTVDRQYRTAGDQPTIGLLLCKSKNDAVVEYALANIDAPLGVSTYDLNDTLPDTLAGDLPSIADLEHALSELPSPETAS